ncbi:N-acetyl-gamma-glutamyl-phosphate reductase [Adhaeribacter rhizoryzae]|uniref:N-acetyl-gamma-glutamyl-phosphate reductase n=1 Tax=Adhaeribacter rhizoryzae TaxID=2607907 RepID=A0A5M6DQP2_9BACT|nr:N-acetyl-gamma-glutamyl-phosphate reductase [Adhaeribacter rhizoryzae]KAA5547785.1 N-acetyl-gamma-glutamyl-phosphate reductase [Adhaeribacter rhizoryzae]
MNANQTSGQKVRVGIVGGAGYTGGELLRILLQHPNADISFVHSSSNGGRPVYYVHTDLLGETELTFSTEYSDAVDVVFLCVGHGAAKKFLEGQKFPAAVKIIDLSQDFRLAPTANFDGRTFVYGLPELQKEAVINAENIANPGCFATCIQLALLPLASQNKLNAPVHISGITGSTGAGQSLSETSHFSWREGNISTYKLFNHQHLHEIRQSLGQLQTAEIPAINFVPYRGNFTRGILITAYLQSNLTLEEARALYNSYYQAHPFVHISAVNPHLKQVVNTNKCILHVDKVGDQLVIISMIDNLVKGASGQAVQNMNLLFGLEETAGLHLKPSGF